MKYNGDHVYFYLGWGGFIFALSGKLFGRYIDLQWAWTILIEKEDEWE